MSGANSQGSLPGMQVDQCFPENNKLKINICYIVIKIDIKNQNDRIRISCKVMELKEGWTNLSHLASWN